MLSDLEARLEDLLNDIAQMPEEYVAKAEKVNAYSTSNNRRMVYLDGVPTGSTSFECL